MGLVCYQGDDFVPVSWGEAFQAIAQNLKGLKTDQLKAIAGDLVDAESLIALKVCSGVCGQVAVFWCSHAAVQWPAACRLGPDESLGQQQSRGSSRWRSAQRRCAVGLPDEQHHRWCGGR